MKTQNDQLINFLVETFQRLLTKSPKYFVILQWLSFTAMVITGLPELLQGWGIVLPQFLTFLSSPTVVWIAGAILFVSKLTTQSKASGVLADGSIVKTTNEKALPFTAVAENKAAEVANIKEVEIIKV